MSDTYYRLVDSFCGDAIPVISLIHYTVFKLTPRGVWIKPVWDCDGRFKKFVLEGKGKRFAYPTFEEARQSYILRKKHHIHHVALAHDRAKERLARAEVLTIEQTTSVWSQVKRAEGPPSLAALCNPQGNCISPVTCRAG